MSCSTVSVERKDGIHTGLPQAHMGETPTAVVGFACYVINSYLPANQQPDSIMVRIVVI